MSNKTGFFQSKFYNPAYELVCIQFLLNKLLCLWIGEYWLRENDVDRALSRFREGVSNETLSSDFVEVCVGPLFTHEEEFHVQTLKAFRMPDESDLERSFS